MNKVLSPNYHSQRKKPQTLHMFSKPTNCTRACQERGRKIKLQKIISMVHGIYLGVYWFLSYEKIPLSEILQSPSGSQPKPGWNLPPIYQGDVCEWEYVALILLAILNLCSEIFIFNTLYNTGMRMCRWLWPERLFKPHSPDIAKKSSCIERGYFHCSRFKVLNTGELNP